MGMTVAELEERMSAQEFAEWAAFDQMLASPGSPEEAAQTDEDMMAFVRRLQSKE